MLTTFVTDAILAEMIEATGPFDPAATWITTYSANANPTPRCVLADLTVPAVANYPRGLITTWGTIYHLADGSSVVDSPVMVTVPPDNVHALTIIGFALVNSATVGDVLEFVTIDPQVTLSTTADHWSLIVRLRVDPRGNWDVSVNFNG